MAPADRKDSLLRGLREEAAHLPPSLKPYVVEACLRAGETDLALDLLKTTADDMSILYLLPQYVGGLSPAGFGWHGVQVSPRIPTGLESFSLSMPVPQGRVSMHYARDTGARLLLAPGMGAWIESGIGEPIMVRNDVSHAGGMITPAQLESELEGRAFKLNTKLR